MAAPKGHKRYGGRKKGTPNKASAARAKAIADSGLTPLDFMLAAMRDEQLLFDVRLDAAKAAAPYVHPKLAAVELTGKDGGPVTIKHVSVAERRAEIVKRLDALVAGSAAPGGDGPGGVGVGGALPAEGGA